MNNALEIGPRDGDEEVSWHRQRHSVDWLRFTSRLGVWSTLAGFAGFVGLGTGLRGTLHDALESVAVTGLVSGGLAICVAAALVLRRARHPSRRLTTSVVAAVALGATVALLGLQVFAAGTLPVALERGGIMLIGLVLLVVSMLAGPPILSVFSDNE